MNTLDKLFGSADFVKVMKLFVLNPEGVFETKEIAKRTRVRTTSLRKHINDLKSIGLIKKRTKAGNKKAISYSLDPDFELLAPLSNLLSNTGTYKDRDITGKFKNAGSLKLVAVSGVFMHDNNSRVDILIVGDRLKRNIIEKSLRGLEADIGRELEYAIFDTPEFMYRLEVYDKFVRDILDYPHKKVVNKIGL